MKTPERRLNTPERRQWRRSGVFIVNGEHIPQLFLLFLFFTLNNQILYGVYLLLNPTMKHTSDKIEW